MTPTSPVSRLHRLISQVFEEGQKNPNLPFLDVLAKSHGLDSDKQSEKMKFVSRFVNLVEESSFMIKGIYPNKPFFYEPITMLESFFLGYPMSTGFVTFSNTFTQEKLDRLDAVAEAVQSKSDQFEMDSESLGKIQDEINELFNYVNDQEIDPEFKKVLLVAIINLKNAVDHYRIYGDEGLHDAIDLTWGKLKRTNEKKTKGSPIWQVAVKLFVIENMVTGVIANHLQMTEFVQHVLSRSG
jgi:hypothetical protein